MDVDAAFAQFLKAVKPFWCSSGFSDIGEMADAGDVGTMKVRVHEYRGVMMTWDDNLGRIAVPPAAQPIVGKLRELNAAEMADLDTRFDRPRTSTQLPDIQAASSTHRSPGEASAASAVKQPNDSPRAFDTPDPCPTALD